MLFAPENCTRLSAEISPKSAAAETVNDASTCSDGCYRKPSLRRFIGLVYGTTGSKECCDCNAWDHALLALWDYDTKAAVTLEGKGTALTLLDRVGYQKTDKCEMALKLAPKQTCGSETVRGSLVLSGYGSVGTHQGNTTVGAIAGYATRRVYRMYFKADKSGPSIDWGLWLPRYAKGPVPVVVFLNYRGIQEIDADPDIPLCRGWSRKRPSLGVPEHRATEATRGALQKADNASNLPIQSILARGYAILSASYTDVSPDPDAFGADGVDQYAFATTNGVFALWGPRDESRTDNITSLGAWAWALSRGLDLARAQPEIDRWRRKQSILRTFHRRPDMFRTVTIPSKTRAEKKFLAELEEEDHAFRDRNLKELGQ